MPGDIGLKKNLYVDILQTLYPILHVNVDIDDPSGQQHLRPNKVSNVNLSFSSQQQLALIPHV